MKNIVKGTCEYCGSEFSGSTLKKFCSDSCRQLDYLVRSGKKKKLPRKIHKIEFDSQIGNNSFYDSPRLSETVKYELHPDYRKTLAEQIKITSELVRLLNEQKQTILDLINGVGTIPPQIWCALAGAVLAKVIAVNIESVKSYSNLIAIGGGAFGYLIGEWLDKRYEERQRSLVPRLYEQIQIIDERVSNANNRMDFYIREQKRIVDYKPQFNQAAEKKEDAPLSGTDLKTPDKTQNKGEFSDVINADDVLTIQFKTLKFDDVWLDLIGEPSPNFYCMVYGQPKSGKSTFAIMFANYLTKFGDVLYASSEEGVSKTLQNKLKLLGNTNAHLAFLEHPNLGAIEKHLKAGKYKAVIIDSINHMNISASELEDLRKRFDNIAFIAILQSTKAGDFKGSKEFEHNVDVVISITQGVATSVGRFGHSSEMTFLPNYEKEVPEARTIF